MKRFLWITDPWHYLDHPKDTTLRLAEEAAHLGHRSQWASIRSIRVVASRRKSKVLLDVYPLIFNKGKVKLGQPKTTGLAPYDSIHYRVDPPVNDVYLHPLQLLVFGLRSLGKDPERIIVNSPSALFSCTEKLESLFLASSCPTSLISAEPARLLAFLKNHREAVLKPLNLCQSKGVELVSCKDRRRTRELLSKATHDFTQPILLQRYLSAIRKGELRGWYLDGRLISFARKFPLQGDFRVNIDRGSRFTATTLNAKEEKSAIRVGRHLKRLKIRLAAVDFIDGLVTDFNITSPGLLRQMEAISGTNLARLIINAF